MSERSLRDIHHGMIRRCHDPRRKDYPKYGGRGIKVCQEWRESFDTFRQWALTHGYKDGMTLDRICNNRGYGPDNCRWITGKQQGYNRKTNRYITIDGETHTLEEWARIKGIGPDTIKHREDRGWSIQDAILTPVGVRRERGAVDEESRQSASKNRKK